MATQGQVLGSWQWLCTGELLGSRQHK